MKYAALYLEGSINHFDTKQDKWISLRKGDVQIIRAGNGISHAEELNEKSEIFQIWFDPNIQFSITKEASYDDYKSDDFEVIENNGTKTKKIAGKNCPMKIFSEGIEINSYEITEKNKLSLELQNDSVYSYFILDGEGSVNNDKVERGDFFIVSDSEDLLINTNSKTKIFEILKVQKDRVIIPIVKGLWDNLFFIFHSFSSSHFLNLSVYIINLFKNHSQFFFKIN